MTIIGRKLSAWKNEAVIATMKRPGYERDGHTLCVLRIPIIVQYRTNKAGQTVYRFKEKYDYNAGDSSAEFASRDECVRRARQYAVENTEG